MHPAERSLRDPRKRQLGTVAVAVGDRLELQTVYVERGGYGIIRRPHPCAGDPRAEANRLNASTWPGETAEAIVRRLEAEAKRTMHSVPEPAPYHAPVATRKRNGAPRRI